MLLRGVLGSLMGGRRKKSKKALRHLTGGGMGLGGGLMSTVLSHPTAALTAAGLAWGVFETLQNKQGGGGGQVGGNQWGGGPAGDGGPVSLGGFGPPAGGEPPAATQPLSAPLPPLPDIGPPGVSVDALRMVRLAVSAASADGAMSPQEREAVVAHAKDAGVADLVEQELQGHRPLAQIVAGVTDPAQRATLYVLAFSVLRADEAVTGAERIYLAQLAHLLNLDPPTVQKLEADAGARIDSAES
jgi:tellurite resistance protein